MADDEDVPPLEDMSDLISKISALKHETSTTKHDIAATITKEQQQQQEDKIKKDSNQAFTNQEEASGQPKTEKPYTFGGMKKGFLFNSSTKQKTKPQSTTSTEEKSTGKTNDDIPLIKPKDPDAKQKQFEIPEVQEAMSASQAFLQNKDWVTSDLLSKVENNETLAHSLTDPRFMLALNEFQTNPQEAMAKYGNNPEMQKFLKEFCALLGDHFTKMQSPNDETASGDKIKPLTGSQQADISVHSKVDSKQPLNEEEKRVQDILADPEIKEILLDPDVKKLIGMLRTDPDSAQRVLYRSGREFQIKIRRLVDVGLLQVQR